MQLTREELELLRNCVQDCANSDDWKSYQEPFEGILSKFSKMINNFN